LAEIMCKMGVTTFFLIDFDKVDEVNLSSQGFCEHEIGTMKTQAVSDRLEKINSDSCCLCYDEAYRKDMIPDGAVVFSCVDCMTARTQIFTDFSNSNWRALFDCRMAAESLQIHFVANEENARADYNNTLFPPEEAYAEPCTAKATIYCANIAAAVACAMFKKFCMKQEVAPLFSFDIFSMDQLS